MVAPCHALSDASRTRDSDPCPRGIGIPTLSLPFYQHLLFVLYFPLLIFPSHSIFFLFNQENIYSKFQLLFHQN